MEATLEAVEDPFNAVFMAIAQHCILQREPFWLGIGDKSLPAAPLAETGDFVFLTGDASDMVAGLLDDLLLTARRASAPAQIAGMPLHLLFPGHAEQSLHAMGFEHEVNRLHERRFIGDLSLSPTSGRRQGSQCGLCMAQTFVQARRLVVGMQGGSHDHDPFRPALVTAFRTTGPFKLIPLGGEHLMTTVIGTKKSDQLARCTTRHPLADPGFHSLRRRPG